MSRYRNLRLFWKLLVPSLTLMIVAGSLGATLVVRDVSARARTTLNEDLLQASLSTRSVLADRELYILESANFAANLRGMADAVSAGDAAAAARLLESALALKSDLTLLVATDGRGVGLVEFARTTTAASLQPASGTDFSHAEFVARTLGDDSGAKAAGILPTDEQGDVLAIASPICSGVPACGQAGVVVAGVALEQVAAQAAHARGTSETAVSVALFGNDGRLLAKRGPTPSSQVVQLEESRLLRHTEKVGSSEVATLSAPLRVQGRQVGVVSVSLPTAPAVAAARATALRLAAVIVAVMAGITAIGAVFSRSILRQVRPLLETNRALGRGDLGARAPVLSTDELGELAHGVNQMAEQLQASRDTLELQVAQRTEEIERLLRERTQLFASISHELRTPLAVILSQTDRLRKKAATRQAPWATEPADMIKDSGHEVLALVNDILDLARAETGRIELHIEDIAVADLLGDLDPTVRGLATAADLTVSSDVPADLPAVRGDRRRLREIVVNVVDNAVKYTAPGGHIAITAESGPDFVELAISDTGVGIPEDVGEQIFEPFYRVPSTSTQRGEAASGIGLALARRLLDALDGSIRYTSVPGAGSTFTVRLPAEPRPATPFSGSGGRRGRPSPGGGHHRSTPVRAS